jgi:hypothetical protein
MKQAEPSALTFPSSREMRLVRGPPTLVNTVMRASIIERLRMGLAEGGEDRLRPGPAGFVGLEADDGCIEPLSGFIGQDPAIRAGLRAARPSCG